MSSGLEVSVACFRIALMSLPVIRDDGLLEVGARAVKCSLKVACALRWSRVNATRGLESGG